jgi:hypothetical protein
MALKPEVSLTVGLATAAVVYGIFNINMPSTADVRAAQPGNQAVETSRKISTWTAAGLVGAISLIAHDPTIFVIGGAMLVVLDFTHRTANATSPATNTVIPNLNAGYNGSATINVAA